MRLLGTFPCRKIVWRNASCANDVQYLQRYWLKRLSRYRFSVLLLQTRLASLRIGPSSYRIAPSRQCESIPLSRSVGQCRRSLVTVGPSLCCRSIHARPFRSNFAVFFPGQFFTDSRLVFRATHLEWYSNQSAKGRVFGSYNLAPSPIRC